MILHTNRIVFWIGVLIAWVVLIAGLVWYGPGGLQYRSNYSFDELVDDGGGYVVFNRDLESATDTLSYDVLNLTFFGHQKSILFSSSSVGQYGPFPIDIFSINQKMILHDDDGSGYQIMDWSGNYSFEVNSFIDRTSRTANPQCVEGRDKVICGSSNLVMISLVSPEESIITSANDLLALATKAGVPQRTHTGKIAEYGDSNYYIQSLEWLDDEMVLVTTTEDSDSTRGGYNDHFIIYDITSTPRIEYQPQLRGCAEPNYINETLYCTLGYDIARIEGKVDNWTDFASRPTDQVLISQKLDQPASSSYEVVNPLWFPAAELGKMNDRYLGVFGSRYFIIFDLTTGKRKVFNLMEPMYTGKPMTHEQTTVFGPTSAGGVEATYEYESVYRKVEPK